jgi:hypothetical protein
MIDSLWPADESAEIQARNHDALRADSRSEIEGFGRRVSSLPNLTADLNRARVGEALRGLMNSSRPSRIGGQAHDVHVGQLVDCQDLSRPTFSLQSDAITSLTEFSRADAQAGTLEVRARVGELNAEQYPSSNDFPFIMGFNRSAAWIGAPVSIPPHEPPVQATTVLNAKVSLRLENIWSSAPVEQGAGSDLIWTSQGDGNLPLRGNALAWCSAGLTILGPDGVRSRKSLRFVFGWENRDGGDLDDLAPQGLITLEHSVAIGDQLQVAGLFVDVFCFAAAEVSQDGSLSSAYAELKCRSGDGFPVPSRLRLDLESLRVRLCATPDVFAPL